MIAYDGVEFLPRNDLIHEETDDSGEGFGGHAGAVKQVAQKNDDVTFRTNMVYLQ